MFARKRVCGIQAQGLRHPGVPESKALLPATPPPHLHPHPLHVHPTTPLPARTPPNRQIHCTDWRSFFYLCLLAYMPTATIRPLCIHACDVHADVCMSGAGYIRRGLYVWAHAKAWCADIRPDQYKCIIVWRSPDLAWCHPEKPRGVGGLWLGGNVFLRLLKQKHSVSSVFSERTPGRNTHTHTHKLPPPPPQVFDVKDAEEKD